MNKELSKKQRLKLFLINISAFALIFTLLGIIVLELFDQSAYQETDIALEQAVQDTRLVQAEINQRQSKRSHCLTAKYSNAKDSWNQSFQHPIYSLVRKRYDSKQTIIRRTFLSASFTQIRYGTFKYDSITDRKRSK